MGKSKFLSRVGLLLLILSGCVTSQRNTLSNQIQLPKVFNQPFNQIYNRPQPVVPTFSPFLPQTPYQVYNSRNYVPIVAYQNDLSYDGSFAYGYTAGDGTTAQAQGYLKNAGNKDLEAQVVQGSYSYTSPEGTPIRVTYIADENGFRAEGAHLPTPPAIPEAIAKSLQYLSRVPPIQDFNGNALNTYDGSLQRFQQQQRQNQLTPLQIQQQFVQSGRYQPIQRQQIPQQRLFPRPLTTTQQPQQNQLSQIQAQQRNQQQSQQNQQELQAQQAQRQFTTQPLQGRPNKIINQYPYNGYRRYQ